MIIKTTIEISNYFDDTLESDFDKIIKERWVKVEDVKIAIIDMMKNDLNNVDKTKFSKLIQELRGN